VSKLVFLQGAESICEVNGFKNVDAVTRVGAEQRLSTLSAKDRYCEAGASKIGLRWLDGRYFPNVKIVFTFKQIAILTTTGCGSINASTQTRVAGSGVRKTGLLAY
jgi:hypothetical protein